MLKETTKFWGAVVLAISVVLSGGFLAKAAVDSGVLIYGHDYIKAGVSQSDYPKRQGWVAVSSLAPLPINISTATTTQIVGGLSGSQTIVTAYHLVTAAANNVAWISGTGGTCGTGTTALAGGTTAATGYNLQAGGGIAQGTGAGILFRLTSGHGLCLVTSAATQVSGAVSYVYYK